MGATVGTPRGSIWEGFSWKRALPVLLAQTLLWAYVQKGLFSSVMEGLSALDDTWGFLIMLVTAIAIGGAAPFCRDLMRSALARHAVPVALGGLGTLSTLALVTVLSSCPATAAWRAATVACLVVQGAAFALLFLGWIDQISAFCFETGLARVVVLELAAVVLCFLATPSWANGSVYLHVLDVCGYLVLGVCLMVAQGGLHGDESGLKGVARTGASFEKPDATVRIWLAFLLVFFLVAGLLSYTSYFAAGYRRSDQEDFVSYTLLFIVLFCMMIFAIVSERSASVQRRGLLTLVLALVAVAFLAFFAVAFVFLSEGEFCYSLVHLIRRVTRVAVFVTLLVMTYRFALDPISVFGPCFLVPALAAKAVQLALSKALPDLAGALPGNSLVVAVLAVGVFMTMCLIAFCFLNMDGHFLRAMLPDEAEDVPKPADDPVETACRAIAAEHGLTARETEVVGLLARGMTAQNVANELVISVSTVNTHAMTAYRKLGIHSKQELAALVQGAAGGGGEE